MIQQSFTKDPDANLDYVFDWSSWLESGETITSYDITSATGLTKGLDSELSGKVVVWLSGGTIGENYEVSCEITTSLGRTDERTIEISIQNR
jgi:hypothetical protein